MQGDGEVNDYNHPQHSDDKKTSTKDEEHAPRRRERKKAARAVSLSGSE